MITLQTQISELLDLAYKRRKDREDKRIKNERELVTLATKVLEGKVEIHTLTEEEKYRVAFCLLQWGYSYSSVERLLKD